MRRRMSKRGSRKSWRKGRKSLKANRRAPARGGFRL